MRVLFESSGRSGSGWSETGSSFRPSSPSISYPPVLSLGGSRVVLSDDTVDKVTVYLSSTVDVRYFLDTLVPREDRNESPQTDRRSLFGSFPFTFR